MCSSSDILTGRPDDVRMPCDVIGSPPTVTVFFVTDGRMHVEMYNARIWKILSSISKSVVQIISL